MSSELFTICFTFGHQALRSLSLAVGDWSDGARVYLKPGYHNLPPLLSNFETLIFNAVSSLPSAAVPPGLCTRWCSQHVLLPLAYGVSNFPYIKNQTQEIFNVPKNITVKLETSEYEGY